MIIRTQGGDLSRPHGHYLDYSLPGAAAGQKIAGGGGVASLTASF
jgi:hypothetical protein